MFRTGDIYTIEELKENGLTLEDIDLMVSEGKLCKYEEIDGIYYVGGTTEVFGKIIKVEPLPIEVITKKYFGNDFKFGSWTELSLLNKLGLCNQVPVIETLTSSSVDKDLSLDILSTKYNISKFCGSFDFKLNILQTINDWFSYIDCDDTVILSVLLKYISKEDIKKYLSTYDFCNIYKLTNEVF